MTSYDPSDSPPIDIRMLEQYLGGDAAFRMRLCEMLLEQVTKDLALIRAAAEAENYGAVACIAHSVKGAAGSMTAQGLEAACSTLEHVARTADREAVTRCVAAFGAEVERLRTFLTR